MDLIDISKWCWDIAKYVISAIIISTFLGGYQGNTAMLYAMSGAVAGGFIIAGIIFKYMSNRNRK